MTWTEYFLAGGAIVAGAFFLLGVGVYLLDRHWDNQDRKDYERDGE